MNCPKCNTKMEWDGLVRTSIPPKYYHKCPNCGFSDFFNSCDWEYKQPIYYTQEESHDAYKSGDYLYKLSHPKDDNLPEGGKRVFIYNGKTSGDGYGVVIGFTSSGELNTSSGYGNYCYGGEVRKASPEEIEMFIKEIHLYDNQIKKY